MISLGTERALSCPVVRSLGLCFVLTTCGCASGELVPAEALDVAALSAPGTTTVLSIGDVQAEGQGRFLGRTVPVSRRIALTLPRDVRSFVLSAPGTRFASFETPMEGELIDARNVGTYAASPAAPYESALLHPIAPERAIGAGTYTLELAMEGAPSSELTLALRRGPATDEALLTLDLVFTYDVSPRDLADVKQALTQVGEHFALAGVILDEAHIGVSRLSDPELAVIDDPKAQYPALLDAAATVEAPGSEGAVTVYLARDLADEAGPLYGLSSGIPGAVLPGEGIVAALDAHRLQNGSVDVHDLGLTMAHEVGHFLGLFHTSEGEGLVHDVLSDTRECTTTSDVDHDGRLGAFECVDGHNLMFWLGRGTELTEDQSAVLRSSPALRPLGGAVTERSSS